MFLSFLSDWGSSQFVDKVLQVRNHDLGVSASDLVEVTSDGFKSIVP